MKRCPSCHKDGAGSYCDVCGEQLKGIQLYSTIHFVRQSISAITNLDGKFYTSFKLLLKKPGYLPEAFLIGRRKPYLWPIQMFLLANLTYFLVQPLTIYNPLSNTLTSHMYRQVYSEDAGIERIVNDEVARREIPFEQYESLFNQKAVTFAKSFVFMMIPLFALLLYLMFGRSRKYYVEHLLFSVHLYAFVLFFLFSFFLFVFGWSYRFIVDAFMEFIEGSENSQGIKEIFHLISELAAQPILLAYLYFGTRRFYRESRLSCFLKSLALTIASLYVMYVYRFLLFWLTFYAL